LCECIADDGDFAIRVAEKQQAGPAFVFDA
jgi:hypothetical protein